MRGSRDKADEKLFINENSYHDFFARACAGFYTISSKTGQIVNCNDCFAQLLGFSDAEDAFGFFIPVLLDGPESKSKDKVSNRFNKAGNEILLTRHSGSTIWVMNYPHKQLQNGSIEGVIVDISGRKKIEELLTNSQCRSQILIENTTDLTFIINQTGNCHYVSPSIKKVLGYTSNRSIKNILNIITDKDHNRFNDFLYEIWNTPNIPLQIDIQAKHKNGTYRTISLTAKNFLEVSEISGILINAQDITDKVKAQEEISLALWKAQELNRQKTQFISTVSHDFRTPLTSISLNIQLLERYIKENQFENIAKNLDRMSNATKRLTALLNEVSLISKEQSGRLNFNPEVYNSVLLIDTIVEQIDYLFQSNVTIDLIKDSMVDIKADQTLITHIVDNLLSNAIKFSPEKSNVHFTMGIDRNGFFNLTIKDKGIGIPEEELKFLFDPYFRASNVEQISGNGLGLSIVKRCVDLHNGRIAFNSKEGKGTTVIVDIPLNN